MVLEIRNIRKSFDGLKVLDDVSFALSAGAITSLFGENGSGKTTLFHIISGFLKADSGDVVFNGKSVTGHSAVEIARHGIGRVWQNPRIFRNLSVLNNLILPFRNHPGEKILNYFIRPKAIFAEEKVLKERAKAIAEEVNLTGKLGKTAGSLSLGQQKLLSTGMLLMSDAALLLMDEPFAGINSQMVEHISEVLLNLKMQGKTICLIEHNRKKAEAISDKTITIVKGRIEEKEIINEPPI
jgi:ABC-type branched-subunit amino acid transport system ATPase component